MLKVIEVALPTSYLHPITSQAYSYPYTTLNFFSLLDTRKCFWDFGETVQKNV